jgi:hypothetical protein
MALQKIIDTTIVTGSTVTDSIKLNELMLVGLISTGSYMSGSMVSFLVSIDDVTFLPLYNSDGTEVTFSSTNGKIQAWALDPNDFYAWNFIKVREGTSASAIAQATQPLPLKIVAKAV